MQAGEWAATADMFESDSFMGIMPLLFGDSPAEDEVAFNADPATARKDVDRMMRSLFQPEVIDGKEAINVCRKPRSGEAVYAYKLANLESLENPPRRPRTEKAPAVSTSGPDPSSTKPPPSKRLRTDPGSPSGRTSQPIKTIRICLKIETNSTWAFFVKGIIHLNTTPKVATGGWKVQQPSVVRIPPSS
jgi:hypothetical protein